MRCVSLLGLVVALATCGCASSAASGSSSTAAADPQPALAARALAVSYGPLTTSAIPTTRYQDVRCARVKGIPDVDYVCSFEMIGLRRGDDEFGVSTVRRQSGRLVPSGGITQIDATCIADVDCWVQQAQLSCGDACAGPFLPRPGTPSSGGPHPRFLPPYTAEQCITGWNIHGGFSPAETADPNSQLASVSPTAEVTKPVYTPYLAAASIGYLASRVRVSADHEICSATFDLGDGVAYRISAPIGPDPWTWLWRGDTLTRRVAGGWNACQSVDGTLAVSGCTAGRSPRDVKDETDRYHLAQVANVGGTPYWLGSPFEGAYPSAAAGTGDLLTVSYAVHISGRLVVISVYQSQRRRISPARLQGDVIVRAHPVVGATVVTAEPASAVTAAVRDKITAQLRPFNRSEPGAGQKPGDLQSSPTRIDATAPQRPLGFGRRAAGLPATVLTDAPAGVGVVRYGSAIAANRFYVVTYRPVLDDCGTFGCPSPPPTPPVLRARYGAETRQTWISGAHAQWVTTILAPHPGRIRRLITGTVIGGPPPAPVPAG